MRYRKGGNYMKKIIVNVLLVCVLAVTSVSATSTTSNGIRPLDEQVSSPR